MRLLVPQKVGQALESSLKSVGNLEAGSGSLLLGVNIVNNIGRLHGTIGHRVNEAVGLVAKGSIDANRNWSALAGIKMNGN